jgi:hypothetical protein
MSGGREEENAKETRGKMENKMDRGGKERMGKEIRKGGKTENAKENNQ